MSAKVHLVKAMVFPVFMYGCESWTIKKAEHRRLDAFFFFPKSMHTDLITAKKNRSKKI